MPRWSGEEGEWVSFLDKADTLAGQQNSREMYTRMAISSRYSGEWQQFADSHLSWREMKQGFVDMENAFPNSPYNLNNFAAFACLAGDRDTARTTLNRIGNSPYPEAWQDANANFDKCRTWANDGIQNQLGMQAIKKAAKDQESVQMLQLAADGDLTSQYLTAINYDNKYIWDIADENTAFYWYRILAGRGEPTSMYKMGEHYNRLAINNFDKQLAVEEEQIAMRYYQLSAIKNHAHSKACLIDRFFKGSKISVSKDYVKAYGWLLNTQEDSDSFLWMYLHIKDQTSKEVREYITDTILKSMNAAEKIRANEEAEKIKDMILQAGNPDSAEKFNHDLHDLAAYEKMHALKIRDYLQNKDR